MNSPLACITSHFNFAGFTRLRQNLWRFVRQMRSYAIPCYGSELHLDSQKPFTHGWENWRQISCDNRGIMFQKEALLNLLVRDLPPEVQYVAWIDGDVTFMNRFWVRDTLEVLEHFKVCQLFTRCLFTRKDGSAEFMWNGSGATGKMDLTKAHPGFAWAARREFWDVGGLYPFAVTGAGDVIVAAALQGCGLPLSFKESLGADAGGEYFHRWNTAVHGWSGDSVGYIGGDLVHEFHGTHKDRDYAARKDALKSLVASQHLKMRSDGVLQWTDSAPSALRGYMSEYFLARREDG